MLGADVTSRGSRGESHLHVATSATNVDILRLLLEYGANVFAVADEGNNCLHWAAAATGTVAAKAERDRFKCSCTLRHEAEEHSHKVDCTKMDCIALILDRGLDPAAENDEGLTPIAVGVTAGHEDVVAALLEHTKVV